MSRVEKKLSEKKSGKKKSSGWRPVFKRRTTDEYIARQAAERETAARRDCTQRERWRSCPARRCRRAGRCDGEPLQCLERSRPASTQQDNAAPRVPSAAAETAARQRPAAPVMSAVEAAAAIKASLDAEPPDAFNRDDLEALIRAGLV